MSDDDLFGRRLGVLLAGEVAGIQSPPGLGAHIRRRRHVRSWTARAALAVPLVVAVLVAALVAVPRAGAGPLTATQVAARTGIALDGLAKYVMQTSSSTIDAAGVEHRTVTLWDPVSKRTLTRYYAGNLLVRAALDLPGVASEYWKQVDYEHQTWTDQTITGTSGGPDIGAPDPGPADIRAGLRSGAVGLGGSENLDGHRYLHLWVNLSSPVRGSSVVELWVDPKTYLPYQSQGAGTATRYVWLPMTPANVAQIVLTAPRGYTYAH